MFTVINPATGQTVKEYPTTSPEDVAKIVDAVHESYLAYRATSTAERAKWLNQAAKVLEDRKVELAALMVTEMGKLLRDAEAEVEKCAWVCRYYANKLEEFLAPEPIATDARKSYVTYQPQGIILAVMPWNFPFWQVFRAAAPNLGGGNVLLLKHASNVPGCALAIEDVLREAGFPENTFRGLLIPGKEVEAVIAHRLVRGVTLTGSGRAGQAVAGAAGRHLKKSVLELGGSDPYLILADADLDHAAQVCTKSRLLNNGQSCIGAKRFIVVKEVMNDFLEKFHANMAAARMGDPTDQLTDLGPLARADLRDELHEQVRKSVEAGARLLLGGQIPEGPGAYYPATILTHVPPRAPAYREELFGPVATVIEAADEAEAIRIANGSDFGLGAAVFTRDVDRGERIASLELEAGCCFVNEMVKSDPRLPFGGIKTSGYGRELSRHGFREFLNVKTVYVG